MVELYRHEPRAWSQPTQEGRTGLELQAFTCHPRWPGLRRFFSGSVSSILILAGLLAFCSGWNLAAQTLSPQAAKRGQRQKLVVQSAQAHQAAVPAIPTQLPASPAFFRPATAPVDQARVTWGSRGLQIEASDASLNQVLQEVAAATGAKLEGMNQDQRIFGSYGPGPGCDVLSELLEGSGYNLIMSGSHDTDAPLRIVLSPRSSPGPHESSNKATSQQSQQDEISKQAEVEPRLDYPPTARSQSVPNPFANGEQHADPVQFMEEILQRQQQIDEQQQSLKNSKQ